MEKIGINNKNVPNPTGKRPLGRPHLRWEDCVARYVGVIEPGTGWREATEDKDK